MKTNVEFNLIRSIVHADTIAVRRFRIHRRHIIMIDFEDTRHNLTIIKILLVPQTVGIQRRECETYSSTKSICSYRLDETKLKLDLNAIDFKAME